MEEESQSNFSEDQLRRLFKLLPLRSESTPSVVCKLCGGVPDCIQEGSNLQDSRAAHKHALLHGPPDQWDDEEPATRPVSYSEAELLRIYFVDSYRIPSYKYQRPHAPPPPMAHQEVWYGVICKLCKWQVYNTQNNPSCCLHEIEKLQEHALRHSEYLCVDGPPVPELDPIKDFKEGRVGDEDGFLQVEDDAHVPGGCVKVCVWCKCENCSSGDYGTVRLVCDVCDDIGFHRTYDCPDWQLQHGRLIPCNGRKIMTTTLLESLRAA